MTTLIKISWSRMYDKEAINDWLEIGSLENGKFAFKQRGPHIQTLKAQNLEEAIKETLSEVSAYYGFSMDLYSLIIKRA